MISIISRASLGEYRLVDLQPDQAGVLQKTQRLMEACADFSQLVDGEPVSPTAAQETFESLPAGKTQADKFVAGALDGAGELVGVLEGVRDYPEAGVWWIGLLLLAPAARGQGLGRQIIDLFMLRVRGWGAAAVMLGVVEENRDGLAFWRRLGFTVVRRTEPRPFGRKLQAVHILRLDLPPL